MAPRSWGPRELIARGWERHLETGLGTEMIASLGGSGELEMRVREERGWSEWLHVEVGLDEAPGPGSPEHSGRTSAGRAWVGRDVRHVQVRVAEGRLRDLEMHPIDSEKVSPATSR